MKYCLISCIRTEILLETERVTSGGDNEEDSHSHIYTWIILVDKG